MLDVMRRRAPLAALLIGVAVAGFLAIGLVQAAGSGPDLGGPVVVSQTSKGGAQPQEGRTREPAATAPSSPERTAEPSSPKRTAAESTADERPATERPAVAPSKRTAKVEPVRPASPRPGGDDGDGDRDDGGHGDDGDDGDDD